MLTESKLVQTEGGILLPDTSLFQHHSSGLYLPKRQYQQPIAVDLFCGCGGFSLGMIQAGFQVVAAADKDSTAAMSYLANLGAYPLDIHFIEDVDEAQFTKILEKKIKPDPKTGITKAFVSGQYKPDDRIGVEHFWLGDVRKLSGQMILDAVGVEKGEIDCVCGGPPCQGFSVAGKRDILDPRNSLLFEFARLILEINPKTFVMENVPGLLTMTTPEGVPVIDAFCRVIADGGFSTYEALKRALENQAEAFGGIQRTQAKQKTTQPDTDSQLSLFE